MTFIALRFLPHRYYPKRFGLKIQRFLQVSYYQKDYGKVRAESVELYKPQPFLFPSFWNEERYGG